MLFGSCTPCRYTVLEEMSGGGGAVDKLVVPCCVLCSMAAATLADPDGATADADKPVIACHVFDSPKPTFRGGGRWGREVNNSVIPWWAQAFCSGMTFVLSPMVNPEPISPRGSPPPLVVTGKPTFVKRAPAGGASRLRLRGRGPVGAVRKRRVRYKIITAMGRV